MLLTSRVHRLTGLQEAILSTRIPSGVSGLDEYLKGGFPSGSLTLVTGPPGTGKSIFGAQFLLRGLELGNGAVLVDTCRTIDAMAELGRDFNWDRDSLRKLKRVECFDFRLGQGSAAAIHIGSFGEVLITINELLAGKDGRFRLVVDSFSDFVLYNSMDSSLRFLQVLRTTLRNSASQVSTLILLECGEDEKKMIQSIEYATDATVRMKADGTGRYLMISRMKTTPTDFRWLPFRIENGAGLSLSSLG